MDVGICERKLITTIVTKIAEHFFPNFSNSSDTKSLKIFLLRKNISFCSWIINKMLKDTLFCDFES